MATSYTANCRLGKPGTSDRNWDEPLNANSDLLDSLTALGALAVTTTESPSTSKQVRVSGGSFLKADGSIGVHAGVSGQTLPASSVVYLWLNESGTLVTGTSFPATRHIRLARVSTDASKIVAITDQRIQCALSGNDLGTLPLTGGTIHGPLQVVTPASGADVLSINAADRLLSFFGGSPASQAPTLATLADSTTGIASGTVNDVGSSYSQTSINNNFASLTATVNLLIAALKRHGLMAP